MGKNSYQRKKAYRMSLKKRARQGLFNDPNGDWKTAGQIRAMPGQNNMMVDHAKAGNRV